MKSCVRDAITLKTSGQMKSPNGRWTIDVRSWAEGIWYWNFGFGLSRIWDLLRIIEEFFKGNGIYTISPE